MVRANTAHDTDTRVTTAQIREWLAQAYKRLRRLVSGVAPSLYTATSPTQALSGASADFSLASLTLFERPLRLEIQSGTRWDPVAKANDLDPWAGGWLEEDGVLRIFDASGIYHLVYVTKPDLTEGSGNYTIRVPDGLEEIVTEAVSAKVVYRAGGGAMEDPAVHLTEVDRLWREQKTLIRRRYGNHVEGGLLETGEF